jgi:ABC-type phosphonate transport system ATPase subunit
VRVLHYFWLAVRRFCGRLNQSLEVARSQVKYKHLVYIEEKDGKPHVIIDRVEDNGRRHFCTHMELPPVKSEQDGWSLMGRVADWLGHSLLVDSPAFREHIGIEDDEGSE